MSNRGWLWLFLAFLVSFWAVALLWNRRGTAPVIVEMPVELITADELIPWTVEEDDSLSEASLKPLLELSELELSERHMSDFPILKKHAEIGGNHALLYLFVNVEEEKESFHEYFGRRRNLDPGETFSLPLRDPVALSNGSHVHLVKKNGAVWHMVPEEFGKAERRLKRIIPLPKGWGVGVGWCC